MKTTTIAIPIELKEKIKEFGNMGENYSDVIYRLIEIAKKRQIEEFLMSSEKFVPIDEAIKEAKEWQE